MTNTLTKQQVDGVIEKLVDKTLSFGCEVELLPEHCPFGKYLPILHPTSSVRANLITLKHLPHAKTKIYSP